MNTSSKNTRKNFSFLKLEMSKAKLELTTTVSAFTSSSTKELAIQHKKTIFDYSTFVEDYEIEQRSKPELKDLECIFKQSAPHAILFYVWFKRHVKYNPQVKTPLKTFSKPFFEFLTEFGYKNTNTTKVLHALVLLAFLILGEEIHFKRTRDGVHVLKLYLDNTF